MPSIRSSISPTPRTQVALTTRGLIAETFPAQTCSNGSIPAANAASGSLVLGLLGLRAGDVVTNLVTLVGTVGTSLTFAKLGLFTSTGGFLAATGSVSATFNAGSSVYKVVPLTSPYTVTADAGYYVGYLQYGAGATGCTIQLAGAALATEGVPVGTGARAAAIVTLQTDISADVTPAAANIAFWFGVN